MKMACLSLVSCLLCWAQLGRAESLPAIRNDPQDISWLIGGGGAWTFYVTSPVKVTGVGFYDHERDGLVNEQHIGIWRDTSGITGWPFIDPYTSTLIAMTAIPSGTNVDLVGYWRKVDFDVALTLEPGGYEIANTNFATPETWGKFLVIGFDKPELDPRILLGAPAGGNGHLPPDGYVTTSGAPLGPVFFIEVPEPSVASLLLVAGMLGLVRRRRR